MTERSNDGELTERLPDRRKRFAGSLLGDDPRRQEGGRHEIKADALAEALRLCREAERARSEASALAAVARTIQER